MVTALVILAVVLFFAWAGYSAVAICLDEFRHPGLEEFDGDA